MTVGGYRHLDVMALGIAVADMIIPKVDDARGMWRPFRAEDIAFLWEATAERGRAFGTNDAKNLRIRDVGELNRLKQAVGGVTDEGFGYCDVNGIGSVTDADITGLSDSVDSLWPSLFPGNVARVLSPSDGSSHVDDTDDIRRLYLDLMRHEAVLQTGCLDARREHRYYENGQLYNTEGPYPDGFSYRYYWNNADSKKQATYLYDLSVTNRYQNIPVASQGVVSVVKVEVSGRKQSDELVSKTYLKTFTDMAVGDLTEALCQGYIGSAGLSAAPGLVTVDISDFCTIFPLAIRTGLSDLGWTWRPA